MALWAKLYVDILGDPKLMSAAREGKKNLDVTPWLFAFSKLANASGRLEINGKRADSRDIAALLPGISASRVEKSREELLAIGVLALDSDGCDYFVQWEKRSGDAKTAQGAKNANAVRQQRYRERHRNGNALREDTVTPLVTPLRNSVEIEQEQEKERRAESVTPSRNGVTRHEPGSAAAVASLPNSELQTTRDLRAMYESGDRVQASLDADAPILNRPPRPDDAYSGELRDLGTTVETPAQSPNGASGKTASKTASDLKLPQAAVKFGGVFYQRGKATDARRSDVFEQLLAVLKPEGLAFNGGVIHATPARLSSACLAVLKAHEKQPLDDLDAALPYLLVKLSDVSQDSPTEKAAVEAKVAIEEDRLTFAERKAMADKIAAEHPEEAAAIDADAVKVFPGKAKEMAQPRESFRVSRLLQLAEVTR